MRPTIRSSSGRVPRRGSSLGACFILLLLVLGPVLSACVSSPASSASPTPVPVTPLTTPTRITSGPGVVIRDTHAWSGTDANAQDYGLRPVGTQVTVMNVSGDRFEVYEKGDPKNKAYMDIADVAIGRDLWEAIRPARTQTTAALCLPPNAEISPKLVRSATEHAAHFAETFLAPGSPGLDLLVRSDFGPAGHLLDVSVSPVPTPPVIWPVPTAWSWNSNAFKEKRKIEELNTQEAQDYESKLSATLKPAQAAIKQLRALSPPRTGSSSGCALQVARELTQVATPTRQVVLVLDPSVGTPPGSADLPRLEGVRVSLLEVCHAKPNVCTHADEAWRSAFVQARALTVRTVELDGPFVDQAFDQRLPTLR